MNTNLEHKRHTLAHLLAAAVLELYPDTKLTLGPAIENGFYYDMEFSETISDKDLPKIEKRMKNILKQWNEFTHREVSIEEAKELYKDNPYKIELVEEIAERGETITLYTVGKFTDLCRGGHLENPAKEIKPDTFKLDKVAGAYWRGDEKNKMLTRIYGFAFETADELEKYIWQQEEAKKRDHRILGKQLDLFTISNLVGVGLPLMKPNGMIIRKEIEDYLWSLHKDKGYSRVWTPHLAKTELYKISGHFEMYKENFQVKGKDEDFMMKPMNCPHHMQIFADSPVSYKDLPIRYFEPATVYRDEKSGQLSGLTRVRSITQDDGHLFCTPDQIKDEVTTICNIIKDFFKTIGMNDYWVSLSVRGKGEDYLGEDAIWEKAEIALEEAAKMNNLPYKRIEGEAAFYGPKLDFMFKDAIGREWQLSTIQCDFNLPIRFNLEYTDSDGTKKQPVVIHRAVSGSLERSMGIFIEHFAGKFPVWLSPTQVLVVPVNNEIHKDFAEEIYQKLIKANIRAEINLKDVTLGKKIRAGKEKFIPYTIVIGDKEKESGSLTVETRTNKIENTLVDDFIVKVSNEILNRILN